MLVVWTICLGDVLLHLAGNTLACGDGTARGGWYYMVDIHGQNEYLLLIKCCRGRGQVWGVVGLIDSNFVNILLCGGAVLGNPE